jgi:flavin reductase (DIM6/NTAB) family NADH-FMN oxidoreductase RutF
MGTGADMLEADFKGAMRRVAASVAIITAFDRLGQPHGLVVSSLCSLTVEPPAILVCVNASSSIWPALSQTDYFGISILRQDQADDAKLFGDRLRRNERFDDARWDLADHAPLLRGAQAGLVCKLEQTIASGTHYIVIGGVVSVRICHEVGPLVYLDGAFHKCTTI